MLRNIACLTAALVIGFAAPAFAAAEVGQPAPEITATDVNGQPFKLSDHKGKTVILEWTNNQCPFVVKHYETGNMQKTQKAAQEAGAEWVTIISSAPGRQGHITAEEAKKISTDAGAVISTEILDESGEIGKAYGATTTPNMFVINPEGTLVYAGAIDSDPSPRHETVQTATNYVLAALEDLKAGKPVTTPTSAPYGCGIKYEN
jgi:peroxiredoxin